MISKLVYKIVIVMIDINDVLRKLNVLKLKKSKDNIDKLIDLIRIDQKINKSFNSKTTFAPFILSAISTQITFEKIIKFFIEAFKIMHFNNVQTIIVDEIQKLLILYYIDNQLSCLLMLQSIPNKYRFKSFKSTFLIRKSVTIVLNLNIE